MKLVNTKTDYVVLEFHDEKVTIHDRFLEAEMKETGILIPPVYQAEYGGKEVILLGDAYFERAFKEIYYPLCIANLHYVWQE